MTQNQKDELFTIYLSECDKLLTTFDKIIMDSDAKNTLSDAAELFRILHTLKGSSAMMEYAPLVDLSHRFENILSAIKNADTMPVGKSLQEIIDAGVAFSAYFRRNLTLIRGGEALEENDNLAAMLDSLSEHFCTPAHIESKPIVTNRVSPSHGKAIRIAVKLKKCPLAHMRAFIVSQSVKAYCSFLETVPENIDKVIGHDDDILNNGFEIKLVLLNNITLDNVTEKISAQPYVTSAIALTDEMPDESQGGKAALPANVMVSQATVNTLINYIDELESEEGLLEAYMEKTKQADRKAYELLGALKHTLREVEVLTASIGTHSINSVFMQMQLTIRTMARELGKEIKVSMTGHDIHVDKSVLEILSDSLIHLVRNAVDHGIETPAERKAAGKDAVGVITLFAAKKNDSLTVTLSDDGSGVNRVGVLDGAMKKGLLEKECDEYTYDEVCNLLLSSCISTKNTVTHYSGRGVGLDTVVRRIRQVGGNVSIKSRAEQGTTFTLEIPMSLKMISGIEVTLAHGEEMIVPVNAVLHIARASSLVCEGGTIEYNGVLYRQLHFPKESDGGAKDGYVLFLSADFGAYYLKVNEISMLTSYYVKMLPECISDKLGKENIFSGCVSCADLRLLCILDAEKLIKTSGLNQVGEVQL